MVVYPPQLTTEEKNLKKRYARLQEKRKLLRKLQEKPPQSFTKPTPAKPSNTETLSPKDAKAAAKRLLEAGKLKISKKAPTKRTGFKRVGEVPGEAPPSKKPNINDELHDKPDQQVMVKKKIKDDVKRQKDLYRSFVKSSIPTGDMERIPKRQEEQSTSSQTISEDKSSIKERTIYVAYQHASCASTEDALTVAFKRFGEIEKIEFDKSKNSGFITFTKGNVARTARKEMDRGMIRGSDIRVEPAGEGNNFIDLPSDLNHPWAKIAAGKQLQDSPSKKSRSRPITQYKPETDF